MVKCVDCGFLSARHLETCRLDEVQEDFRKTGLPPNEILGGKEIGYPTHKRYPICFMRKHDLPNLFNQKSGDESKKFLEIVNEDRQCEQFIEWHQGSTPKEHQEILDRERKWEQERRSKKSDRIWHVVELVVTLVVGAIIALVANEF